MSRQAGALVRIAMWSGPRNISTAMMRSFGNRPDTIVMDEPFYAAYLAATGLDHPMRADVLASQPAAWEDVTAGIMAPPPNGISIVYQKHMTHHMLAAFGLNWMADCRNAFLIREPEQVLRSYVARQDKVTLQDIGIRQQCMLFDRVSDGLGRAAPVIDAADVLAAPKEALAMLCDALGIAFCEAMLHWPAGRRPSDGVWAPAWYQAVEASTGFAPAPQGAATDLAPELAAIARVARPYYERLAAHKLHVTAG